MHTDPACTPHTQWQSGRSEIGPAHSRGTTLGRSVPGTCLEDTQCRYGGRGADAIQQVILNQEEAKVKSPNTGFFSIGQGMAAPTMMTWATDAQKKRYLPKLASGEEVWCQLFSEPAGG